MSKPDKEIVDAFLILRIPLRIKNSLREKADAVGESLSKYIRDRLTDIINSSK